MVGTCRINLFLYLVFRTPIKIGEYSLHLYLFHIGLAAVLLSKTKNKNIQVSIFKGLKNFLLY